MNSNITNAVESVKYGCKPGLWLGL